MKKIALNRETVRRLDRLHLGIVRGGDRPVVVHFGRSGDDCGGGGGGGGESSPCAETGGGNYPSEFCSVYSCDPCNTYTCGPTDCFC